MHAKGVKAQKSKPHPCFADGWGFMDLKSNFSREWTAGVLFRMQRGVQPTIRLSSLIVGNRQVTVCRAGVSSLPWHLCPPRLHLRVEPQGTVRWRHAPLLGPLRQCPSKHKSLSPAASRRPPVGRRGHRKTAGSVDALEIAPVCRGRQPLNSRLPKNVIAWRLREGKSSGPVEQRGGASAASVSTTFAAIVSTTLCQEHVRPLFFPLARSRERRLNP